MKLCDGGETKTYLNTFNAILRNMIVGMMSVNPGASISGNFIMQMIPHHRAAIQMSKNVLHYSEDAQIKGIACTIISEQTKSIADMQKVFRSCQCYKNSECDIMQYQVEFQKIATEMYNRMSEAKTGGNIDCDFLHEMIPHHEGAIRMSQNTLQYCICPELKPILQSIIISQCRGVEEMKKLIADPVDMC